jgi:hypothetical protein
MAVLRRVARSRVLLLVPPLREAAPAPSSYHRLSVAAKQGAHRERMREPSIACPHCHTQTTTAYLLRHVQTGCEGRRAPHPLSRWIPWGEVIRLGVPRATLCRWVGQGRVLQRGAARRRQYLLRDVTWLLASRTRPWFHR